MLKVEKLEQKLRDKQSLIGTHCMIGEPVNAHILALQGFDILWIDTEHSAIDRKDLNQILMVVAPTATAAFVRVTWNDPQIVKPVLEMGVDGIIFPNIRTPEEAERAVASVLYPPDGIRGYGPQHGNLYGLIDDGEYLGHIAKKIWKIIQIEDWRAVDCLEEILAVPGIDAVQIGPNDLSASMGKLKTFDPEVWDVFEKLIKKCKKSKIPVGTSIGYNTDNLSSLNRWVAMGIDWINVNSDISFLVNGAKETLQTVRKSLSDFAEEKCNLHTSH